MAVPHFTIQFGLGDKGGNRIDYQDVDGAGADEGFGDFEGLLTVIGLRNQQVVDVDPQFFGVAGIQCMFGIDKGSHPTAFLSFGNDLEGDRGLAGRFGTKNLDYPPSWKPAYTQRCVARNRSGGNDGDRNDRLL